MAAKGEKTRTKTEEVPGKELENTDSSPSAEEDDEIILDFKLLKDKLTQQL